MSAILISASDYEPAVAYFYPYAQQAIIIAQNKNYEVLRCLREQQNRDDIFRAAPKAALILHNGHGNASVTTGHGSVVIWEACNYPTSTVEKKIIFLLSCLCGQILGPDMARKGASAVIAWDETYIFNAAGDPDPLKDPYVQLFFNPILIGYTKVLNQERVKSWFDTIISEYAKVLTRSDVPEHVKANIAWDANHMRLFGNPDATIQPPQPPPPPAPPKPKKVVYEGYVELFKRRFPIYLERREIEQE